MASPNGQSHRENIQQLCAAVQAGNITEVETILQRGMYINADEGGNTVAKSLYRNLLMLAIDSLQVETAKLLIRQGVDVKHKRWGINGKQGAREMAIENGLTEVVDVIDSKLPASQLLYFAVVDGDQTKVEKLLKHIDTDINMKTDIHGDKAAGCSAYTLLMLALKNGHVEVANCLIDHGINLDFEHQEWDRPDATSDPIMVESYDARKLALDTGMVGVANAIDKRKGGVVNGNATTTTNGVANHKQMVAESSDERANNTTQIPSNKTETVVKDNQVRASGCCVIS